MSKAQRDKGLAGEREVRHLFEQFGIPLAGTDVQGDHLAIVVGRQFHVETKRQETLAMDKWSRQAETEAISGSVPLVCYRRSRQPWRVSMRLEDLLVLLADLNKS